MKKIISILIVLVLALSLTASGGSGDGEGTANKSSLFKPTLTQYINKDALSNTDNITILLNKIDDENKGYVLNIKAPNISKDLKCDNSTSFLKNDTIEIEQVGTTRPRFIFKDYKFTIDDNYNSTSWPSDEDEIEVISEDANFLFVKTVDDNSYYICAKDGDRKIEIEFSLIAVGTGKSSEERAKEAFNIIKESFTFASVTVNEVVKNDVIWQVPDVKTITIIGEDKSTSLAKDWVFANDILYKSFSDNGLNIISSCEIGAENLILSMYCDIKTEQETELVPMLMLRIDEYGKNRVAYDDVESIKEFAIGNCQYKVEKFNESRGSFDIIIKTKSDKEYKSYFYVRNVSDLTVDNAQEYLEKLISAK